MTNQTDDYLRDNVGPLPAELRTPLADLLDALERWNWVGEDKVMDEWMRITATLTGAYRATLAVVESLANNPRTYDPGVPVVQLGRKIEFRLGQYEVNHVYTTVQTPPDPTDLRDGPVVETITVEGVRFLTRGYVEGIRE